MEEFDHNKVTSVDLLALAGGDPDARLTAHVASCTICSQQVTDYKKLGGRLHDLLFRADCLETQTLADYSMQLLTGEPESTVRMHLADCPFCAAELTTLREVLRSDPFEQPAAGFGALKRLIARLLPAPAPRLGLAGVRGVAVSGARTYRAGDISVSISLQDTISKAGRQWMLLVLVLNEEGESIPSGTMTRLMQGASLLAEEQLDEWGNVVISDIPEGVYDLEVLLPAAIVVVEGIVVTAAL